jgi:hypothetical protein
MPPMLDGMKRWGNGTRWIATQNVFQHFTMLRQTELRTRTIASMSTASLQAAETCFGVEG